MWATLALNGLIGFSPVIGKAVRENINWYVIKILPLTMQEGFNNILFCFFWEKIFSGIHEY